MQLNDIVKKLNLEVICSEHNLTREVKRGYVSDLLSDVIANTKRQDLWVTIQTHQNIIAVAVLKEVSAIILPNGRKPQEDTLLKAKGEGVVLLFTDLPAFEVVGRLYEMVVRGV